MTGAGNGAVLLDEVRAFMGRFIVPPLPEALDAIVLWAAHAHMAGDLYTSPRLALLSPEPASGKTRVLEVLNLIVPRPLLSFSASTAAIFRSLAVEDITLLFDEVDTIFNRRGKDDGNEDLRALLNAGYRRGAMIPRCVGPNHEVRRFPVFAPVALAGIGDLPDTIMSRSIIIRMRRRASNERIAPFRVRSEEPRGAALRDRLAAWAAVVAPTCGEALPTLPEGVGDRESELWEPLVAIADVAGQHWPRTARAACAELLKVASDREFSPKIRLLGDLRTVFADADALSTSETLDALKALEEAPWADIHGKALSARYLARMLKGFGIESTAIKVRGRTLRGYRREDLWDSWERYLGHGPAGAQLPQPGATPTEDRVGNELGKTVLVPHGKASGPRSSKPLLAEVAHVAQGADRDPSRTLAPAEADSRVAEVALVRGTAPQFVDRAAAAVANLQCLGPDESRRRSEQATNALSARFGVPTWIRMTAAAEPIAVAATLELMAEDASAGHALRPWPTYLAAARQAVGTRRGVHRDTA